MWAESSSLYLQVEINLKRYPTPYPEDLKNMVKSVQNLVGKTTHPLNTEKCSSGTNMELHSQDKYEPKWPIAPKEVMLLYLFFTVPYLGSYINVSAIWLQSAFFFFFLIKRIDQTLNFDWNSDKQIPVTTILMHQVIVRPEHFKIGSRDHLGDPAKKKKRGYIYIRAVNTIDKFF